MQTDRQTGKRLDRQFLLCVHIIVSHLQAGLYTRRQSMAVTIERLSTFAPRLTFSDKTAITFHRPHSLHHPIPHLPTIKTEKKRIQKTRQKMRVMSMVISASAGVNKEEIRGFANCQISFLASTSFILYGFLSVCFFSHINTSPPAQLGGTTSLPPLSSCTAC